MKPLVRPLAAAAALVALLLAACAHPWNAVGMAPGTSREEVIAKSGPPTRVVPLPGGGQRLQYSFQPAGRQAFMMDFDAAGKLVQARQVLNLNDFQRIQPDTWTAADVEREFGPPGQVDRVASWNGPVMTYYWRDFAAGTNMYYWVYLDGQGVVRRAHPGMELLNAPNMRF